MRHSSLVSDAHYGDRVGQMYSVDKNPCLFSFTFKKLKKKNKKNKEREKKENSIMRHSSLVSDAHYGDRVGQMYSVDKNPCLFSFTFKKLKKEEKREGEKKKENSIMRHSSLVSDAHYGDRVGHD